MKVKVKQVAEELGVSIATVSLAMNNKPGVNENTRKKIMDYIRQVESEYLVSDKEEKNSIKMLLYMEQYKCFDMEDKDLFSISYMEIFRRVNEADFKFQMVYIKNDEDIREVVTASKTDGTAGIFVNSDGMTREQADLFEELEIPVMFFNNECESDGVDHVVINNGQGIRSGIRHLMKKGHSDIVYFYNSYDIYNFARRREAFAYYMQKYQLPFRKESMVELGSGVEENYRMIKKYIEKGGHIPTAVFCESYAISLSVLKALQENGYQIGKDVSIIGVDELPQSSLLDFRFTHIKIMHTRQAQIAIDRLLARINGEEEQTLEILVNTRLIEGDSVRELK